MNWLHYLAEANLYLAVFYLVYSLLLSRETHYQLNRAFLLFSCVAAFALPVLQVGALKSLLKPAAKSADYTILPDRILEKPMQFNANTLHAASTGNKEPKASAIAIRPMRVATAPAVVKPQLKLADYFWYVYLAGVSVMLVLLMARLISLFLLTRRATVARHGKYKLIQLPGTNVAFSFFGYLFLGDNAPATDTVITHELVHIRQKHSADIIFLELLKAFNWFNPFIYLLQNSLKAIHEYIADQQTVAHQTDTLTYATFLVNTAHGAGGSPITHSFFNRNLLKKRIIMLNQKPSGNSARLKYLVIAPICAGLLCVSTLAFSKNYSWIDLDPAKAVTTIIKPLLHQITPAKHEGKPKRVSVIAQQAQSTEAVRPTSDHIKSDGNNASASKPVFNGAAALHPLVDTAAQTNLQKFYNDLKWYIQYPESEKGNHIQGRVIARFCVDDSGELQYLAIFNSPSHNLSNQVFWAIQHSAYLKPLKGNWAMSVQFTLGSVLPQTTSITQIPQDTTTKYWPIKMHDKEGKEIVRYAIMPKPMFTYDPQNMNGPYKTPVKVLNELVIKGYNTYAKN